MKRIGIYISCICFGLTGCESMIQEVPAPDEKPEMVVSSIIHMNWLGMSTEISMSKPVFGSVDYSDYEKVEDALVIISDGINSDTLFHNEDGRYEQSQRNVWFYGSSDFELLVTRPNGMQARATCKVPSWSSSFPKIDVSLDSNVTENFLFNKNYIVKASIHDMAGSNDYYKINGWLLLSDSSNVYVDFGQRYRVFDDKSRDGEVINLQGSSYYKDGVTVLSANISLYKLDRNLFLYYGALNTAVNNFGEEVPFLEPTIVPSNIENGLGVFGAQSFYYYSFEM